MSKKMTIDGNTAAAHIAYAFSEVAAIYPITPSSPMAESCDEWTTQGRRNILGSIPRVSELQSEGGASGAMHGALSAGALTSTFTASQGLLLMIPNMYKIAGELLPCVFHVSARSLAYHALSIFGDHSDVMACRQTGFAMLASASVQECMDLALVSHLATLKSRVPFLHFFDGFRTSHEIAKVDVIDYEDIKKIVDYDDIRDFKARALNPEHPIQKGTAQNPDIYFQNREACNTYYENVPDIVQGCMDKVASITGRQYHLVDYYGSANAKRVIVIMGSGGETVHETVDYLNKQGANVGVIKIRLYRPFPAEAFVKAIPQGTSFITVLDRTKESGSVGEPLYQDVITALSEYSVRKFKVYCGRYGLGSKEFTPSMVGAIYDNMRSKHGRNHFTVGINDDVTYLSLPAVKKIDAAPPGSIRCKFYGLGSDGTVGANKNSIKIIGNYTDKYVQGYFAYDSKKSGGITISHLRFGDEPIRSAYLINTADFVACHNPSYVTKYDMITTLRDGGTFLLNCSWTEQELDKQLPCEMKKYIAKHNINLYTIDAISLAKSIGLGGRINTVMQSAFFKLCDVIPYEDAAKYMKEYIAKTFGKKGEEVVAKNCKAVDIALDGIKKIHVPVSWRNSRSGAVIDKDTDSSYFNEFVRPILAQQGDYLPVSAFNADGSVPTDTAQYEKRGIAVEVPEWQIDNCIQCNQCSMVCPHACIRPILQKPEVLANAPKQLATKPANGYAGYQFRVQISVLDCTGCGSCINVCPAPNKALVYKKLDSQLGQTKNWDYAVKLPKTDAPTKPNTLKGSQFNKPYFEFSGACAGCGETPYIKLVTQLFGDQMIIANATGCSSIYGGSAPTCPYSKDSNGHGPAWANSLFEDNAEYGYGMAVAYASRRNLLREKVAKLAKMWSEWQEGKSACEAWIAGMYDKQASKSAAIDLLARIEECKDCGCECDSLEQEIYADKDCLVKKSIWIIGGDGWAYDIGYGGLDHVIASGEDVNILVLDTEVYSNTGGQASKSSPTGAIAKFAAGGKRTKKKDLGMMAMSYGYVYTAQISMGANMNQCVKAISEAESYDGPSLLIAYAPCINHGINMSNTQLEMKKAVECGYWQLYRYNPSLAEAGKNPFVLDSKAPQGDYQQFLMSETRYRSLAAFAPETAKELFAQNEKDAKDRYASYERLASYTPEQKE